MIKDIIEELKNKVGYNEFSVYLEDELSQSIKYNGILDYHTVSKSFRSNSYIENYNRRIKHILGKYILYKNIMFINNRFQKIKTMAYNNKFS